jgi:hypothetical protein
MTEDRFVLMAPWQYEQLKVAIGDRLPSEIFADYVKRKPVPSAEYHRLKFGPELP